MRRHCFVLKLSLFRAFLSSLASDISCHTPAFHDCTACLSRFSFFDLGWQKNNCVNAESEIENNMGKCNLLRELFDRCPAEFLVQFA